MAQDEAIDTSIHAYLAEYCKAKANLRLQRVGHYLVTNEQINHQAVKFHFTASFRNVRASRTLD